MKVSGITDVEVHLRAAIDAASSAIVFDRKGETDEVFAHIEDAIGDLQRARGALEAEVAAESENESEERKEG
jgi:hypothetical protein